ncbi:multi-sensor signal transduction histidine kinase [[Leptolyngbya] sp. PCC 7376]|uniref:two-component system sensor histidine kinase NblS n=1 Tax=[Leptolyngbya] sp. PCC 7376 TaxID=111781 RepID=UPI00029F1C70|nr:ATP-binding protein [[Leptolyngbya] sp. PCC 7376]AFY40529.1 multi-sensor signal transduction histidine kinase [[Leptolyngbya] sp. PCC 7376]
MLTLITKLRDIISRWWSEFTLQTKLMAAGTLAVSLLMSGFTFWAVNSIQQDAKLNDTRFGSDLGLLLEANVSPLVASGSVNDLAEFTRRFYNSTESVRYLIYANVDGDIFYGIPYSEAEIQNSLTIARRITPPDDYAPDSYRPISKQHATPNGEVTDVFVPLHQNDKYLGVMVVGINPNATVVASSNLTRDVTLAVFVFIWVMVILGGVFNALTITRPIKELLDGVKNIATGNFQQRIDLPFGGELGELILNFNEMAERLESYQEQNIDELTSEKAKLETLVATIADGAVLLDTDLKVILVNPTAKKIFNWDEQAIAGETVLYHLPASVTTQITKPLFQIAAGENPDSDFAIEHHSIPSEGSENIRGNEFKINLNDLDESIEPKTVRILLTEVTDNTKGSVRGIAMTVQDITKEAELNKAKSQFISNVSHELRTPLFNIKSFIETLHEYGEDLSETEKQEFLATANHETDRLTRLVNDVLDLSRLESSRVYNLEAVDLVQPIEQTLRTYQLNARDQGIELAYCIDPELPQVLGHYDLLLQVLTNLVGNSLKFTKDGGKIVIQAYTLPSVDDTVRIEIADTGIGIDPEDQEAIFDRFFRVENRVHTLEGTGLGLSIVQNIIEKHNSRINLISEVGIGTTFWFELSTPQVALPESQTQAMDLTLS